MSLTSAVESAVSLSIYNVLKGEHGELSLAFKGLEATTNNMDGVRDKLFDKIRKELISHTEAEQKTVYESFRQRSGEELFIEHAEEEHAKVEELLNQLNEQDKENDEWMNGVKELAAAVQAHVDKEESQLFDKMKQVFTDEEADELAKAFKDEKQAQLELLK